MLLELLGDGQLFVTDAAVGAILVSGNEEVSVPGRALGAIGEEPAAVVV